MKRYSLVLFIILILNSASAQDCMVMHESLKGVYVGDCVNGKADGKGKATGFDTYQGDFKKGLPDGEGTYTWKNEQYYVGNWKKGLRDGRGTMHNSPASYDSIQTGFWKKDKYIGLYENPYEVRAKTNRIIKINCRIADRNGKNISFSITKISEGIVSITDVNVVNGQFFNRNTQNLFNTSIVRFNDVTFPFRAIFNFGNGENAEIIFNEKANYDIEVQLM